jgi:hypothetical protein
MASPGAVGTGNRWSKRKRARVTALVIAAVVVGGVLADLLFHLRPVAAESFWLAGLRFGVSPLQEEATFRLRNYPTRSTAAGLVAYIHARSRAGDVKLAARATETLCILSGRSFGTTFTEHARGHFWRSPEDAQWPEVLKQIDLWSERALGAS